MGEHSFQKEKVIDSREHSDGTKEYLIKWKGQKLHLCQWLRSIEPELIARYEADLRSGKTQSGKGAYSYKRALRREAKAMDTSTIDSTQKFRSTIHLTNNNYQPIEAHKCLAL